MGAALREIEKQKAVIFQLRNRVASLQAQTSAFEKTAAEHSKMEQHGKEQSKAVMEWRQKYEVAKVICLNSWIYRIARNFRGVKLSRMDH